jgi:hypothetical protein
MLFSWLLVLAFCILLDVRLTFESPELSWPWVFSPVFSLLGFWWVNCFVVLLKHVLDQVNLKVSLSFHLRKCASEFCFHYSKIKLSPRPSK